MSGRSWRNYNGGFHDHPPPHRDPAGSWRNNGFHNNNGLHNNGPYNNGQQNNGFHEVGDPVRSWRGPGIHGRDLGDPGRSWRGNGFQGEDPYRDYPPHQQPHSRPWSYEGQGDSHRRLPMPHSRPWSYEGQGDSHRRLPMVALFEDAGVEGNKPPHSPSSLPPMSHDRGMGYGPEDRMSKKTSDTGSKEKVAYTSFHGTVLMLLLLIFVSMLLAVTAVAITFARGNKQLFEVVYGVRHRLLEQTYSPDLNNISSQAFMNLEQEYCIEIESLFDEELLYCNVDYFSNGSVVAQSSLTFNLDKLQIAVKEQGEIPSSDVILTYIRDVIRGGNSDGLLAPEKSQLLEVVKKDLKEEVHFAMEVRLEEKYESEFGDLSSTASLQFIDKYCSCITLILDSVSDCEVYSIRNGSVIVNSTITLLKMQLHEKARELGISPNDEGLAQAVVILLHGDVTGFFSGSNITVEESTPRNRSTRAQEDYPGGNYVDPEPEPESEPEPEPEPENEPESEPEKDYDHMGNGSNPYAETTAEPYSTSPEPYSSSPEPNTSSPEPNTSSPEPNASSPEPNTSSQEPNTSSPEPNTSSPEPNTNSTMLTTTLTV